MSDTFHNRRRQRISVDIPVTLTTVLDSLEATIVDISEGGAQIRDATLPRGELVQIEYDDQTIYGRVMWSEVDRMGVRFPFELRDGPLFDRLEAARRHRHAPPPAAQASQQAGAGFGRPLMSRFGRRA